MKGRRWTREETTVALSLYYQIPFGKINQTNSVICKIAKILSRTPASLAMKMCNLARFDKSLQKRNISGLKNGSKLDGEIFKEFENKLFQLAIQSEEIILELKNNRYEEFNLVNENGGRDVAEKEQTIKTRVGQDFFRAAVMSAYETRCCITGINVSQFLIASHIKPWHECLDKSEKVNPANGLCLNALHDKAFDQGYITIDKNYRIIVSEQLKKMKRLDDITKNWIISYENKEIRLPHRNQPNLKFIEYHNDEIFKNDCTV